MTLYTQGNECKKTGKVTAKAKKILDENSIYYKEIDVNKNPNYSNLEIASALAMDTGYQQVPNIYFGH